MAKWDPLQNDRSVLFGEESPCLLVISVTAEIPC